MNNGVRSSIEGEWNAFHQEDQASVQQFLATLNQQSRNDFIALTAPRFFRRGSHVFYAAESAGSVYIVQTGRIKFYDISPGGKEIILWFCFPGDIFGLCDVAYNRLRNFSAQACENSELMVISQSALKSFLKKHPRAALPLIDVLLSRLRVVGDTLTNLISDDASIRIIKLLLRLSTSHGKCTGTRVRIDAVLTHQEIADMVGTTRQTVTSVLNQLKRAGRISVSGHCIYIEDGESLSRASRR